jgi:hypothetical protein
MMAVIFTFCFKLMVIMCTLMGNVFEFDLFKLSLSYLVFFGNHAIGVKYTMIY